jgi:hypothetical protein
MNCECVVPPASVSRTQSHSQNSTGVKATNQVIQNSGTSQTLNSLSEQRLATRPIVRLSANSRVRSRITIASAARNNDDVVEGSGAKGKGKGRSLDIRVLDNGSTLEIMVDGRGHAETRGQRDPAPGMKRKASPTPTAGPSKRKKGDDLVEQFLCLHNEVASEEEEG